MTAHAAPDVDLSNYPLPVQEAFRRLQSPGDIEQIALEGDGVFAAIYERVSDPRLEEGYSLNHQRLDGLLEAHTNGWRVRRGDVFRETASGEDIFERPLLTIIRERVRQRVVRAVVYPRDDRFARDPAWIELVIREHWHYEAEVRVVGAGDDFTDDTPLGYLLRAAKGFKAKQEVIDLRSRVSKSRHDRVHLYGRPNPSARGARYGYEYVDAETPDPGKRRPAKKVACRINEDQMQWVRRMFVWCLRGWSVRAILQELNRLNVPPPKPVWQGRAKELPDGTVIPGKWKGGKWTPSIVSQILNEPAYCGEGWANRSKTVKVNVGGKMVKRKVQLSPDQWVRLRDDVYEAVITRQEFDAARQLRDERQKKATRRAGRGKGTQPNQQDETTLLVGMVRCGVCVGPDGQHGKMYYQGPRSTKRGSVAAKFRCNAYFHDRDAPGGGSGGAVIVSAQQLRDAVWARVRPLLVNPAILEEEIERMRQDDPVEADIASTDRTIAQLEQVAANFTQAVNQAQHPLSITALTQKLDETNANLARLRETRGRLEGRRQGWAMAEERLTEIQQWFRDLAPDEVDGLSFRMKRQALEVLDAEVVVMPAKKAGRYQEPHWSITLKPLVSVQSDCSDCTQTVSLYLRWVDDDDEPTRYVSES